MSRAARILAATAATVGTLGIMFTAHAYPDAWPLGIFALLQAYGVKLLIEGARS